MTYICNDCQHTWLSSTEFQWCKMCASMNVESMIQSHIEKDPPITTKSYLVIVEQTPDVDDDDIINSLEGALTWMEGVGSADVISNGEFTEKPGGEV